MPHLSDPTLSLGSRLTPTYDILYFYHMYEGESSVLRMWLEEKEPNYLHFRNGNYHIKFSGIFVIAYIELQDFNVIFPTAIDRYDLSFFRVVRRLLEDSSSDLKSVIKINALIFDMSWYLRWSQYVYDIYNVLAGHKDTMDVPVNPIETNFIMKQDVHEFYDKMYVKLFKDKLPEPRVVNIFPDTSFGLYALSLTYTRRTYNIFNCEKCGSNENYLVNMYHNLPNRKLFPNVMYPYSTIVDDSMSIDDVVNLIKRGENG